MINVNQMVATGGNPEALLARTSGMLAVAESAEEIVAVRNHAEAVRTLARKLKANEQVLFKAACLTIRAEHALGRELARIPLAKGSPGNQKTGKVDRLPKVTGPLRLGDLGISKRVSHRAQQISKPP